MNKAFVGVVQNKVAPNPKCNGCLHYNLDRSVCTIGLAPSGCGDGSMPDVGYAPLRDGVSTDVVSAESPSHAAVARVSAGVPEANARVPIASTHLGDESELIALSKSLLSDLRKSNREGCEVHQYGVASSGPHNLYTGGGTHCTCRPLDKSQLVMDVYRGLSPQARSRLSIDVVAKWLSHNFTAL